MKIGLMLCVQHFVHLCASTTRTMSKSYELYSYRYDIEHIEYKELVLSGFPYYHSLGRSDWLMVWWVYLLTKRRNNPPPPGLYRTSSCSDGVRYDDTSLVALVTTALSMSGVLAAY